jgi:hypothetical protein
VLTREIIAARRRLPREGLLPGRFRSAQANPRSWWLLVTLLAVLAAVSLLIGNDWLGQTPDSRYSPRTWLWGGFGTLAVLASLYLTLALARALRNTRRPTDNED